MIHLGYLAYDFEEKEVYIPNKEVSDEFINAVGVIGWTEIITGLCSQKKNFLISRLL